jgi:hypothetical protein
MATFNGKDDHFARWLHGICAVPLLLFVLIEVYLTLHGSLFGIWAMFKLSACGYGLFFIFFRLLKYAFTGEGNINNEL